MFQIKPAAKIIFTTILLVFLFSLPCFALTTRPVDRSVTISGKVIDLTTKKPISAASVSIKDTSNKVITHTNTDSYGNYRLNANLSGSYFVYISKEGYIDNHIAGYFKPKGSYVYNFSLKTLKTAKANNPPKILSITPKERFTLISGDSLVLSAVASDSDKDKLQYRYLLDNSVIKGWTDAQSFTFPTSIKNRGRHKVRIETRDNKGGLAYKEVDIYIFRSMPRPTK